MAQGDCERFDVVIGGGSFAGQALAIALAASLGPELRIAVVDREGPADAAAADYDVRASALSAASVAMLEALGVWPAVASEAEPIRDIDITDTSLEAAFRPAILHYDNTIAEGRPATVMLENHRLRRALAERAGELPGVSAIAPAAIDGLELGEHAGVVALGDGRRLAAPLIVAADGRASLLRSLARIKCVGWSYPQIGIITTVAHEKPHSGRAIQHFLPAGPFAILPLRGDRSCVTWTEEAVRGREIMAMDDVGFLKEVERRFGLKLGEITLAGPKASFPIEMHIARSFVSLRLALVGDAAHSVHPIAGQGLNLALRDVAALAEVVADTARLGLDIGGVEPLARYERWRRFDSFSAAAVMDGLNRLFSNDWTPVRMVRDLGLGIVERMPGVKSLLVREAAGLTGELPKLLRGELA
jgi:2-octaprenyl-6-methoxyphenol hydroxylase